MPVAKPLHSLSLCFRSCSSVVGSLKASLYKTVFQGRFFCKCWCKRAGLAASSLLPASSLGGNASFCFATLSWCLEVSKVGLRASGFRYSQLPLVWWPGRWHTFELWCNSALGFFCSSSVSWVWTEPRQSSCAIPTAGQANEACLCLLRMQPTVFVQGERAGGFVF